MAMGLSWRPITHTKHVFEEPAVTTSGGSNVGEMYYNGSINTGMISIVSY